MGTAAPGGAGAPTATSGGLEENVASALCYVLGFLTGILFLVLAPYNQNKIVRFHAFQSIFLSVALFVIHICLTIIAIMVSMIAGFVGLMFSMLHLLVSLAFFILWLLLMWKAYNREKWVLPVIGPLAEKQA